MVLSLFGKSKRRLLPTDAPHFIAMRTISLYLMVRHSRVFSPFEYLPPSCSRYSTSTNPVKIKKKINPKNRRVYCYQKICTTLSPSCHPNSSVSRLRKQSCSLKKFVVYVLKQAIPPHTSPPWLRKDNLQNAVIVRCTCLHVAVQRNVPNPLQSIQTTTRQI